MSIGPEQVLAKRKAYLLPCLGHFYQRPPQFVRGSMQYLYDSEGKEYLDFFAGVSVMNCGHSNPYILERVSDQLHTLQHVCNIYLTQPVAALAERMAQVLPGDLSMSFFCNSGSEAMDGAMVMARTVTGKKKFVSLVGGLHGRTQLTMGATGIPMWRTDPFLSEEDYFFVDISAGYEQAVSRLSDILSQHGHEIAGFLAEPIQGNAGILTPPEWFFTRIKTLLEAHQVLMIMDEVQTGFGRCGYLFASEAYRVVPDVIAYAKALGNGIPIGGFSTTPAIASQFTKPSASTLGGNPISSTAGLAVLDYLQQEGLVEKSRQLGEYLQTQLQELKQRHPLIKEVRGMGLMVGMELVSLDGTVAVGAVDTILETLKDRGIILGRNGLARNVLAFQPPLVISQANIDHVCQALEQVLIEVTNAKS